MKKLIVLFLSIFFWVISLSLIGSTKIEAADCMEISDVTERINCLQNKLNELSNTENTLSSQIQYIDTQTYLTQLKIVETENKITSTQNEIEILSSRIDGLNNSLDYLSKLLLDKVVASYKQRSVSLFNLLLDSVNATDLIDRIKYLRSAQESNQKLLVQVQETKLNFEEQKQLRETKKKELDTLQSTLNQQKIDLQNQLDAKKNLLAATQNSETVYKDLLEKAKEELAGFSAFTQSAGGGLTTFGNGSNGWYYTQRDPSWGNMLLPGSSSSVLQAGCAVTSVAMVCKSYGQNEDPATIVGNPNNFIAGDLWNWAFSCSGKTTDWIGTSQDQVKNYVKNNTPVILKLSAPSVSGLHFVVAFGWDDGKNDFKIHDPFYGPDKFFSDRYNWSQVITAIAIH